ncbi:SRPBCC family protein [Pseudoduganella sp. OTU4001]|uniref:SRPBCC family protein n=1 Tax=Pseudoduganella sp. OTU4001 TaxID=3043854 RepID=UPI00313AED93
MSFDTQAFRNKYRANIAPYYNPWLHGGFVLAAGLAVLAFLLRTLDQVSLLEWLTVPLTLVFYSWGEYHIHKGLGHKKLPLLPTFYKRHTGDHHSFFADGHMRYDFAKDWRVILFPAWLIVIYSCGALLAWGALCLLNENVAALFAATLVGGYLSYEILHACEHFPPENPVARLPWVRHMRHLHELHHRRELMQTHNFNIVFPLWDWIYGTLYWQTPSGERRPSAIRMQHQVDIPLPPAQVLEYASTPRRWHEWHPYHVDVTAPEGALPAGSRFEYFGGRAGQLHWEVLACEPGRLWQASARGKHGLELLVTYECAATAAGTRFVRTLEYRFASLLVRLADRLVLRRRVASDSAASLQKLAVQSVSVHGVADA